LAEITVLALSKTMVLYYGTSMYKSRFPDNNVDETTPDSACFCFHIIVIVCFLKIVPLVLVDGEYFIGYFSFILGAPKFAEQLNGAMSTPIRK
jgi:uncharacterized membrane protein